MKKIVLIQTANIAMKVLIQQLLSSFVQLRSFSSVFKKDFYFPQSEQG